MDEDLLEHLAGLVSESDDFSEESIEELMGPFLESVSCPEDIADKAKRAVIEMASDTVENADDVAGAKKLRQGLVNLKLADQSNTAEEDNNRFWWVTGSKVHEMTNPVAWLVCQPSVILFILSYRFCVNR